MTWKYTKDQLPHCYETGDWDGKKSDLIVGETLTGKKFLGCCYSGFEFFDWYQVDDINRNDWLVNETVVRWFEIAF